jgi:hypothetical protein
MNFEKAFEELTNGKRIRRKKWEPLMHLNIHDKEVKTYRGEATRLFDDPSILLSKDWYVLGDTKRMKFIDALAELKQKKHITRDELNGGYIFVDGSQLALCKAVEYNFMPTFEDMCGNDWEILK